MLLYDYRTHLCEPGRRPTQAETVDMVMATQCIEYVCIYFYIYVGAFVQFSKGTKLKCSVLVCVVTLNVQI